MKENYGQNTMTIGKGFVLKQVISHHRSCSCIKGHNIFHSNTLTRVVLIYLIILRENWGAGRLLGGWGRGGGREGFKQNMPKTDTWLFAKIKSGEEHQKTMEMPGRHIDALGRVEEK